MERYFYFLLLISVHKLTHVSLLPISNCAQYNTHPMVLSSIFRKFVSDKMKSRAGTRRWSGYAPHNCLKAYAGGGVKSGEAVHLDP